LLFILVIIFSPTIKSYSFNLDKSSIVEWERVLKPLREMPVQDFGLIRSTYTFCDSRLMALIDSHAYKGMSPVQTVMRLISDPEFMHNEPIIKIVHPYLTKVFSAKRISLSQYVDSPIQKMLDEFYNHPQIDLMKPINEIESKVSYLKDIEYDFAIIPRPKEWLSPIQYNEQMKNGMIKAHSLDQDIIQYWEILKKALRENDTKMGKDAVCNLAQAVFNSAEQAGY